MPDHHTEKQLENALVNHITKMLGQFGADFTFIGQQFRLELDGKEYFIDILFYHHKLKSMIAIELKINCKNLFELLRVATKQLWYKRITNAPPVAFESVP